MVWSPYFLTHVRVKPSLLWNGIDCWHCDIFFLSRNRKVRTREREMERKREKDEEKERKKDNCAYDVVKWAEVYLHEWDTLER